MEPVRPQVDSFLLDWLRRTTLQREWFFEERDGNCRMTGDFASRLSETSKLWRQAVGPLAEWVSQTLWSTSSSPSRFERPTTRLTQTRKREAKEILLREQETSAVNDDSTPSLSPSLSSLPRPVPIARVDVIAQSRRAESQRQQIAARKTWSEIQKPDWFDENAYVERIRPLLAEIGLPAIASELGITTAYASRIRSGDCVPHPRHWGRLAEIAGVTEL
jgi:hypothetical protein